MTGDEIRKRCLNVANIASEPAQCLAMFALASKDIPGLMGPSQNPGFTGYCHLFFLDILTEWIWLSSV